MTFAINRRQLLAGGASLAALGGLATLPLARHARAAAPVTTIRAERRTIEVLGKAAPVFGLRQPDGTAGIVTELGKPYRVRLENRSGAPTLVHWHGLKPPYRQDGVPDVSGPLIRDGGAADYDFPLTFPGTFWMHAHTLQEQALMAAPLIIRDPAAARRDEQEVVVLLHDFSFKTPEEILAGLRGAAPAGGQMTMGGMSDMSGMPGMSGAGQDGQSDMPMQMGGNGMAMDLNDVAFDAFLANDRTLADPETVPVEPGGRILLRLINGAAASNFRIDLGGLSGTLIAVDGHPVVPVMGSRFPIAMAQRLDLRISLPKEPGVWPLLAVVEGSRRRTGIVLAGKGAHVRKVGDQATTAAQPLGFSFERSLRASAPLATRPADRVHRIDLTGSMAPYVWGLNGVAYDQAKPYPVAAGERVELVFANRTMMSHPMHLHGHVFQVVAIDGQRFAGAVRDTVLVPPMASVTVAFDADNRGRWVFHCHNLYHMAAGMMGQLLYDGIG